MRILAYAQLLQSYSSLTLDSLAHAFGVTVDFVDKYVTCQGGPYFLCFVSDEYILVANYHDSLPLDDCTPPSTVYTAS
jgi:hypothetical protein